MISIIIPIYNEAETLPMLYDRLISVIPFCGDRCEIIFVDDGSSDASMEIMKRFIAKSSDIRVVKLSRNFGHQAAISAGLKHAAGDAVAIMDGDLQDPPEELPRFLQKWREGYDVVYAVRTERKEGSLKRLAYGGFYRFLGLVSDIQIPLDAGDFCVMDRRVVQVLNEELPERVRFVRGLRSYAGFKQTGLKYERHQRAAGEVKYTFRKLVKLALDGIFGFTLLPLKMATYAGVFIALSSFLLGMLYLTARIFNFSVFGTSAQDVPGFTTLAVGVFFLGGIVLVFMGILGEYIGRIYIEVKKRPLYIVDEVIKNSDSRD
ncbi:MAG: glycosyltransferase family 2 protein [Firmicutes bacterium]|nr:glycosyltransferase family 2 protein [Bacillota bacterium]